MASAPLRLILPAVLTLALVLAWPALERTAEVALAVSDIAGHPPPEWLDARPPVLRITRTPEPVGIPGGLDLYQAGESPHAALLLLHGLTPHGKDDPRLARFARQLARAGFLVAVPQVQTLSERRLRTQTVGEMARAMEALEGLRGDTRTGRAGVAAISVAAGPAILALGRTEGAARPEFLLTIGAYYDLVRTLRFQTTGVYEHAGVRLSREPNDYAKWAFVLSQLDRLPEEGDRRALARLARSRLAALDGAPEPEEPAPALGPRGQAVLAFVENEDPTRFDRLFRALPESIRDGVHALDLASADLAGLDVPALLVHGRNDPVVPFPETRDLARALGVPDSRVFVIDGLQHVADPGLADAARLWLTVDRLLRLRDGRPPP